MKHHLRLPVHLPSSVWGFLSTVDFKLLARPLDLMVAALKRAFKTLCALKLALCSWSSFPSRTPSIGLVSSQFHMDQSHMEIKRGVFSFYAFQCSMMCIYPCLQRSLYQVHNSREFWEVSIKGLVEWLMTFLKQSVSWFVILSILLTK